MTYRKFSEGFSPPQKTNSRLLFFSHRNHKGRVYKENEILEIFFMSKSGWKFLKLTQAFVYADSKLLYELLLFVHKKGIRETVERKECVIYETEL